MISSTRQRNSLPSPLREGLGVGVNPHSGAVSTPSPTLPRKGGGPSAEKPMLNFYNKSFTSRLLIGSAL